MKKRIIIFAVSLFSLCYLSSCDDSLSSRGTTDIHYRFDTAICHFPDGTTATYPVSTWVNINENQIHVVEPNGTVHLLSISYTELVKKKETSTSIFGCPR